jgi:hypothetical protein
VKFEHITHSTFVWTLPSGMRFSLVGDQSTADELTALFNDAERYRWLRAQGWFDNTICAVWRPKDAMKLGHVAPSGEQLDVAIDAEMNRKRKA